MGQVGEMPVDGGPGDAELGGDVSDGVQAPAVGSGFLVPVSGDPGLACGEFGRPPAGATRARAAARPSRARSDMRAWSNSAMEPRI